MRSAAPPIMLKQTRQLITIRHNLRRAERTRAAVRHAIPNERRREAASHRMFILPLRGEACSL